MTLTWQEFWAVNEFRPESEEVMEQERREGTGAALRRFLKCLKPAQPLVPVPGGEGDGGQRYPARL